MVKAWNANGLSVAVAGVQWASPPRGDTAGEFVGMLSTGRRSGSRGGNALCQRSICCSGMLPMPAFLATRPLFGEFASSIRGVALPQFAWIELVDADVWRVCIGALMVSSNRGSLCKAFLSGSVVCRVQGRLRSRH